MFQLTTIIVMYLLEYSVAQDVNCNFTQEVQIGETYYIKSPNYPNNYTREAQCNWTAYCPSGYNCHLKCTDFELPDTPSCDLDHIIISRGDPQLLLTDAYCGQKPFTTVSAGQNISVALITSQSSPGGRFLCELKAQSALYSLGKCRCGYKKQNRIVGGVETGVNEYPAMVGIVDRNITQIKCGGVIIDKRYVLTAAHCLVTQTVDNVFVVVGEHDVDSADSPATRGYRVSYFNIHPNYNESNYDYDIALIRVAKKIMFSDRVGPVCLPFKFYFDSFAGDNVTVLGWGTLFPGGPTSNVLRKVDVEVISQGNCSAQVSTLTSRQMCTYTPGKDACQDDSGGPLLYTDPSTGLLFNVGVVSYGRSCASGSPGVNTRVTALLSWIVANTPRARFCRK